MITRLTGFARWYLKETLSSNPFETRQINFANRERLSSRLSMGGQLSMSNQTLILFFSGPFIHFILCLQWAGFHKPSLQYQINPSVCLIVWSIKHVVVQINCRRLLVSPVRFWTYNLSVMSLHLNHYPKKSIS